MTHAVIYDRASSEGQKDNWSRQDALTIGPELAQKHGFDTWEIRQEVKSGEELANEEALKARSASKGSPLGSRFGLFRALACASGSNDCLVLVRPFSAALSSVARPRRGLSYWVH